MCDTYLISHGTVKRKLPGAAGCRRTTSPFDIEPENRDPREKSMSRVPTREEPSIFHGTMADMTYPEIEQAARDGAVVLWALGVIEQHGPHLPLGTDVYVPTARLRRVQRGLEARAIQALIAPPCYWGVNFVTGLFPGTFHVRPEILVELMLDVFRSLRKDGFQKVFCFSGHGEARHNVTIDEGVRRGRAEVGIDAHVVLSQALLKRLGLQPGQPHLVVTPAERPSGKFMDVHAGAWETSVVWASYPDLVRTAIIPSLRSTDFGPDDLAEWRKGGEAARRKTPQGYLGDPAAASPEAGSRLLDEEADAMADAIVRTLQPKPAS
jgi:creatinine amidohydrolase